ncbi:MAG: thiamine-phosphate kinase [bacterium]|nr:thiamine-phosphate kinase [Gammaproteobacteria bacterium]HIL94725.1 thiamine-phosphate kinase [Pseudomonadales bacterium]
MDEFEIIRRFFVEPITFRNDQVVIGPGDDCAVVRLPAGYELCVSTDTLVEGVHFTADAPAEVVVSRALGANLSDLAAMGAQTHGFTLALTLPGFSEQWLSCFSTQLNHMVEHYRLPLIGGNLSRGQLSITINIMGMVPAGQALLRSGAQVGDDIYVSGFLGDAAGGLELVKNVPSTNTDNRHFSQLIARYTHPVARLDVGQALLGLASAAIDISDGFAADLAHLCSASGVGSSIIVDSLPVSEALRLTFGAEKARTMAIQGGDDYELCFTVPHRWSERVTKIGQSIGCPITRIGTINADKSVNILDRDGRRVPHTTGYRHF